MNKQPFDAVKKYPFEINDDTIAYLAADDNLLESYRAVAGAVGINRKACLESFFASMERIYNAVSLHDDNSFPMREEFRVSWSLLRVLENQWKEDGKLKLRQSQVGNERPYYVHRTKDVNNFTAVSVYPLTLRAEHILSWESLGELGDDKQKLLLLLSALLKCSWGSAMLRRHSLLWSKGNADKDTQGLNLKYIMLQFGYAFLPQHIFDWDTGNIAVDFIDMFPGVDHIIQRRHRMALLHHND